MQSSRTERGPRCGLCSAPPFALPLGEGVAEWLRGRLDSFL